MGHCPHITRSINFSLCLGLGFGMWLALRITLTTDLERMDSSQLLVTSVFILTTKNYFIFLKKKLLIILNNFKLF